MADVEESRRTTIVLDMLHFILVCSSLHYISYVVGTLDTRSQAFIQTDKHLTYIVGDVNGIPLHVTDETYPDSYFTDEYHGSRPVRFDPLYLDFREQSVGMPKIRHITVQNLDVENSLFLLSISGSTVHFHCSFFQDKKVPPGGNTTFDVVFLARQEGNVENTLYVHTSKGSFKYQVFGVGTENPYRLRPYLGAKVPVNTTFTSDIKMHNPHSSTLQVLEMYSSAGDLHLELPVGEKEAKKHLWEIPPYETKSVMRACFVGHEASNHTAFIRIKTNQTLKNVPLILPMEVEVSESPGLYSPQELLDFGILRTLDEPKSLRLNLINSADYLMHISSVNVSPRNDAVTVDFRPLKLQPSLYTTTPIARITYSASKAVLPKQWSGNIVVKTKSNIHKLSIPYRTTVLRGLLTYTVNMTYFYSAVVIRNTVRFMTFTNTFNFSIVIFNVTLPLKFRHIFSIVNFNRLTLIRPQQTVAPFQLKFHPNATHLLLTFKLTIYTNVSSFDVPIVVYNGLFKIIHHRPEKYKGQLDFGTLGIGENRSMTFTLRNDNPITLVCGEISTNMNNTVVEILGVEEGNGTTLSNHHDSKEYKSQPLKIKPYHFAVFSVNMLAPKYEGSFTAEVYIMTQFQDLFIPLTLRTAEGSLHAIPEKLLFDKTYPGRSQFKVLKMYSSFAQSMDVQQVSFRPPDSRFYYAPSSLSNVIRPKVETVIGNIYFDQKRECNDDCYVGLPTHTPAGRQWLLGLQLTKEVADTDQYMYSRLRQKWADTVNARQNTVNVTIELDTNEVRGFLFSAQAQLHWPSVVRKCKIKFPLTQIGNVSVSDFIVENLGSAPIVIQVLPLSLYPNTQTILDILHPRLSTDLTDYIDTDDLDIFTLPDQKRQPNNTNSTSQNMRVEPNLGVQVHVGSIVRILGPGEKVRIQVGFKPLNDILRTSIILIRNNLTMIDAVVVQGQGARGEMRFSNRRSSSTLPLLFEMTEKHLKNCDKRKQIKNTIPHFTVKRTFTMHNTGELPFYVRSFTINGAPCEGYGYKILECSGFELMPNSSRKIDVAFTPDFTMSRIRRTLTIDTSLGAAANYTLQATIPTHMLSRCASSLPRPTWEPILYYSTMCIMNFLLFCILVAAYFEADRIFVADILKRRLKLYSASQIFDKGKVFDLKNLCSTLNDIQMENAALNGNKDGVLTHTPQQQQQSHTSIPSHPLPLLANGHVEFVKETKSSHFLSKFVRICLRAFMLSLAFFTSTQPRPSEIHVPPPEALAPAMPDINNATESMNATAVVNATVNKPQQAAATSQNGYLIKSKRGNKMGKKPQIEEHASRRTSRDENISQSRNRRNSKDDSKPVHEAIEKTKNVQNKLEKLSTNQVANLLPLWAKAADQCDAIELQTNINHFTSKKHENKTRRKIYNNKLAETLNLSKKKKVPTATLR